MLQVGDSVMEMLQVGDSITEMLQVGDSITEMLQVGDSVRFDSIPTNKERLTDTFPGYHSGYYNLFRNLFPSLYKRSDCTSFLGPSK